jgi:hypothetical protein
MSITASMECIRVRNSMTGRNGGSGLQNWPHEFWDYLATAFSLRGHFRSASMSGSTEKATYSLKWSGRVVMHLNEVLCGETRNYARTPELLYFMYHVCGMNINMDTRTSPVQREPTVPKGIYFFLFWTSLDTNIKSISVLITIEYKHIYIFVYWIPSSFFFHEKRGTYSTLGRRQNKVKGQIMCMSFLVVLA